MAWQLAYLLTNIYSMNSDYSRYLFLYDALSTFTGDTWHFNWHVNDALDCILNINAEEKVYRSAAYHAGAQHLPGMNHHDDSLKSESEERIPDGQDI